MVGLQPEIVPHSTEVFRFLTNGIPQHTTTLELDVDGTLPPPAAISLPRVGCIFAHARSSLMFGLGYCRFFHRGKTALPVYRPTLVDMTFKLDPSTNPITSMFTTELHICKQQHTPTANQNMLLFSFFSLNCSTSKTIRGAGLKFCTQVVSNDLMCSDLPKCL